MEAVVKAFNAHEGREKVILFIQENDQMSAYFIIVYVKDIYTRKKRKKAGITEKTKRLTACN